MKLYILVVFCFITKKLAFSKKRAIMKNNFKCFRFFLRTIYDRLNQWQRGDVFE